MHTRTLSFYADIYWASPDCRPGGTRSEADALADAGAEPKKRGKGRKGKKKKGEQEEEDKANSDDEIWRQYGSDEELDAPYLPPVRLQPIARACIHADYMCC